MKEKKKTQTKQIKGICDPIRCRPQTTAARYYSMSEEVLFQRPSTAAAGVTAHNSPF